MDDPADVLPFVVQGDFHAWLWLQRYKLQFIWGVRAAIWWLRISYKWDDDKEEFIK